MGRILNKRDYDKREDLFRLVVICDQKKNNYDALSMNRLIAKKLMKIKPNIRSLRIKDCLLDILSNHPDITIIKDIDVLFNPNFKIDVLRILIEANKQRSFSVIWPGKCTDGRLYYSEESLPDYSVFEINDYDIYCVK